MASITLDGNNYDHIIDVAFVEVKTVSLPEWINDTTPDIDMNVWNKKPLGIIYTLRVTDAEKWTLDQLLTGHQKVILIDDTYAGSESSSVWVQSLEAEWEGDINWTKPWRVTIEVIAEEWSEAALSDWNYRKSHIINYAAGAGTNYQVRIKAFYNGIPDVEKYFTNEGHGDIFAILQHPAAYYYNNKTYVVFSGSDEYDPYIMFYNHTTKEWSDVVKVADSPIATDYHGTPCLIVTNDGYIHVFYGSHNSPQKHAKSDNPEDISSFTVQADISGANSYPKITKDSSGNLYLFMRDNNVGTGQPEAIRKSTDNGSTWSSSQLIIGCSGSDDRIYAGRVYYDSAGGKIHIVWHYFDGATRKHIYHAYYKISDGHMYDINDNDLGTSISKTEADSNCKPYDSGTDGTYGVLVYLDSNGNPFISFTTGSGSSWALKFFRWNGTSWTTPVSVGPTRNEQYIGNEFIVSGSGSSASVELYSRATGPSLKKYLSSNGGATWDAGTLVLEGSGDFEAYTRIYLIEGGFNPALKIVFRGPVTKAYGYGDEGFVFSGFSEGGENVDLHGHCRTDFGDVRFTDNDSVTELSYWMGDKVDSDYAIFWVKVVDDLSTVNRTIYTYYGKADATTTSNFNNTFINNDDHFDDQTTGDVPTGWSTPANGSFTVQTDQVKHGSKSAKTVGSASGLMLTHKDFGAQTIISIIWWIRKSVTNKFCGHYFFQDASFVTQITSVGLNEAGQIAYYDGSWHNLQAYVADTWYKIELKNFDWTNNQFDIYIDDVLKKQNAAFSTSSNQFTRIQVYDQAVVHYGWRDSIILRKCVNPEPAHGSWGSEEIL